MSNFIDFNEQLTNLRVDLMRATEALMKTYQPPFTSLSTVGEGLAISTAEGTLDVETIYYDFLGQAVQLKTSTGEIWDYSDLDTDDMVAIYENIYYQMYEKNISEA
jgi:uncharacterized protein YprB with RNaseH-like and TPR domain